MGSPQESAIFWDYGEFLQLYSARNLRGKDRKLSCASRLVWMSSGEAYSRPGAAVWADKALQSVLVYCRAVPTDEEYRLTLRAPGIWRLPHGLATQWSEGRCGQDDDRCAQVPSRGSYAEVRPREVDMLIYAMDNPAPATIIVISGDRDFAYAISTLRLRQYDIVLITLSNAHISLTSQASLCYDWIMEVLGINDSEASPAQTHPEANGVRGDADGFRFPPLKMGPTLRPNTPNKAANVLLPKSSPRKQSTRLRSSSFHQVNGSFSWSSLTPGVASGSGIFQNLAGFQSNPQINMDPTLAPENSAVDISDHFYSQRLGMSATSASRSDISGPEDQDPFLSASRHHPSPRISSGYDSSPERPISRATPARGGLEAPSPTPQRTRTSFQPIPTSINFETTSSQGFVPINTNQSRGSGTPASFSEASWSSQCSSAPGEVEPLGPPLHLSPASGGARPAAFIPPHFAPLVGLLQSYHARGMPKPFRPSIAMEIISANNSIYASLPDVKNFTDYAQLAAKAGIVDMGGEGGEGWIALRAEYLEAKLLS